jgi:hypothetical protein
MVQEIYDWGAKEKVQVPPDVCTVEADSSLCKFARKLILIICNEITEAMNNIVEVKSIHSLVKVI